MQIKDLPVYVISLPHAVERQKKIKAELARAQINFEFIEATDDRQPLSDAELALIGGAARLPLYAAQLNQGALGCLLSHLRCYEKLLQSDNECMLLLEDDALLATEFVEVLERVLAKAHLWNLLHLGYGWTALSSWIGKRSFPINLRLRKRLYPLQQQASNASEPFYLGPTTVNIYRTHGYLINRQASQLILARHTESIYPIDYIMNNLRLPGRCIILPRLVLAAPPGSGFINSPPAAISLKAAHLLSTDSAEPTPAAKPAVAQQYPQQLSLANLLPLNSYLGQLLRRAQASINIISRTSAPGNK